MFWTPGSLNRISPNLYKVNRNDYYCTEIKIAIFQSVWKQQRDEWRSSLNCGRIAAKIARFNSVNYKIIGQKFTTFGYDVAWLLPLNLLNSDLRSANPLSNAKAKSKGRSTRRRLYKFLCLKLWGHWSESHQISTGCTEITADYSAEIKIAIIQSVWKRQRDEWRSSSNCGQLAAKIAHFDCVNFDIIGQKFTKFGYDVAWLLPLKLLKADLRSANPSRRLATIQQRRIQTHTTGHTINPTVSRVG